MYSHPPSPLPKDEEIGSFVAHGDPRFLALSLAHLTGDSSWVTGVSGRELFDHPESSHASEHVAAVRDAIVRRLPAAWSGDSVVQELSASVLAGMLKVVTATEEVGDLLPKLLEDLGIVTPEVDETLQSHNANRFSVLVIGAGPSGLQMAARLSKMGVPFTVLEKNTELGGTWHENVYPGCGVDTPNHLYAFQDGINSEWTLKAAKRAEILEYIKDWSAERRLAKHIRYGHEAVQAEYREGDCEWTVVAVNPQGERVQFSANVLVYAAGSLNRPKYASVPGIENFEGEQVHTARWPDGFSPAGRQVALVGTGSSGVQIARELAGVAERLTIIQRSPHWISPNPLSTEVIAEGEKWCLRHVPLYAEWQRFFTYWDNGDKNYDALCVDPSWSGPGISSRNESVRAKLLRYIDEQLEGNRELIEKVTPEYPPYGKRMVMDNDWYRTLLRPNVSLATGDVARATPDGLLMEDGTEVQADVLVHATGFHGTRFLWPMEVRGRRGLTPQVKFDGIDEVRAYLGITIPDFPNLFVMVGPNSGVGHGGSSVMLGDFQSRYIASAIREMVTRELVELECREEAFRGYNADLDEGLADMVWSSANVPSRYKNASGRITSNHPWRINEYWTRTRNLDLSDYHATSILGSRGHQDRGCMGSAI